MIIKEVLQWNNERGLLNSFDIDLEFNMLLEEVLELKISDKKTVKELVEVINSTINKTVFENEKNVTVNDVADACIDVIIIAIGTLAKIIKNVNLKDNKDLSIDDIEKIIKAGEYEVIQANNKKPKEKDSNGKIIKGDDFVEPIILLSVEEIGNRYIKPMLKSIYNEYIAIDKDLKVEECNDFNCDYCYVFYFNNDTVNKNNDDFDYNEEFEYLREKYADILIITNSNIDYRLYYDDIPFEGYGLDITEELK